MEYRLAGDVAGRRCSWVLGPGANDLGRSTDAAVVLPDPSVSRRHARIVVETDSAFLEDLSSHNGTLLNGQRISGAALLRPGDKVTLGSVDLWLEAGGATPPLPPHLMDERETKQFTLSEISSDPTFEPRRLLGVLRDLGDFLVREHSEQEVYEGCLETMQALFDFDLACLLVKNAAGKPEVRAVRPESARRQRKLALSRSHVQRVLDERASVLLRDTRVLSASESVRLAGIRSALAVPLFDNQDVIGVLYLDRRKHGAQYGEKHLQRLTLLANFLAVKITNARLARVQDEIRSAAYIQRTLLCGELPRPHGYEVCARLVPATTVAGDLYEALALPQGSYLYALGDVVGHGVGAALVMANVLAAIRALAQSSRDPLQLVERLQEQIAGHLADTGFVTLFLGVVDPKRHELAYVNAGHGDALLVVPGSGVRHLTSTGPAVGMRIGVPMGSARVELHPGTLLCVCSDGVPEAYRERSGEFDFFGLDGFERIVQEACAVPLAEVADRILASVDGFLGGVDAPDDRTLLLLRRCE